MSFWPHYVYIHYRADNGEPFYVGKGTTSAPGMYGRAHDCDRTRAWTDVATAAGGVRVEILAHCSSSSFAVALEYAAMVELAKKYPLVNVIGLQKDRRAERLFLQSASLVKAKLEHPELFVIRLPLPAEAYSNSGLTRRGRPRRCVLK